MSRIDNINLTRYTQKVKACITDSITKSEEKVDQKISEAVEKIFGEDEIIFNCGTSTETIS